MRRAEACATASRAGAPRRAGRLLAAAIAAAIAGAAPAASKTEWEYAKFPDSRTGGIRHTVQTKIRYNGAVVSFAFVCARGRLVLTVVATWPIAAVVRYRFPPEAVQWIRGSTPVPSAAVFEGAQVRKLFATALIRRELMIRIPGPRTIAEKTLELDGFAEKAQPVKEACSST